jgi:hypothetical protein
LAETADCSGFFLLRILDGRVDYLLSRFCSKVARLCPVCPLLLPSHFF